MRNFLMVVLCSITFHVSLVWAAESYPGKPVRIVVAYPPGGGTDILTRTIGQKLGERLGQSFVVDNRPGANGNIGSEIAARATPDGYTLLMGTANLTVNPNFYANLSYHVLKDFSPISLLTITPNVLVVNASMPVHSVQELITYAKSRPGVLNFASNGNGSSSHLSAELFDTMAGVRMAHIPFKGGGPALTALLGGEVQVMFGNPLALLPQVKTGKLRALAITSAKRSNAFPELPTISEAGLTGYVVNPWYGLLAPAGTPKRIVNLLSHEVVSIVQLPDIRAQLKRSGAEPVGDSPAEFRDFLRKELVQWAKVIQQSGAKLD